MKYLKYFVYFCLFLGLVSGKFTPETLAQKHFEGIISDFLCVFWAIILLAFWLLIFVFPFYLGNIIGEYAGIGMKTILVICIAILTWEYWKDNPKDTVLKNRPETEQWQSTTEKWIKDKPFNKKYSYFLFYNAHLIAYSDKLFFDKYIKPQNSDTLLDNSFALLSAPFFLTTTIFYSFIGTFLSCIFTIIPPYLVFLFGIFKKQQIY